MSKTKMEWAIFDHDDNYESIYVNKLTREEYEDKYRGFLTCIHGCKARIKFTERKNGIKFYSTWNKEGNLHDDECEFHVKYTGKVGRKKLEALNRKLEITDDQIERAIIRKFKEINLKYLEKDNDKSAQGTNKVESLGNAKVNVFSDGVDENKEVYKRQNITSIKAEYVNSTYLGIRKCVIGEIKNSTVNEEHGKIYGYLNLKNDNYNISAYFPEAFFEDNKFSEENFKRLVDIINNDIDKEKALIVCFGEIRRKKKSKNDFNINIINPRHVRINGKSLYEILKRKNIF